MGRTSLKTCPANAKPRAGEDTVSKELSGASKIGAVKCC